MAEFETLRLELAEGVCRLRLDRPQAGNAIDARLVAELGEALSRCEAEARVVVLEGGAEVFCAGGDFEAAAAEGAAPLDPEPLYELWQRLAGGSFVSIALVRGRANAGGLGFVAASDIVLADRSASFALSELLFGLFPACVLPFLVARVGRQKAHYMTLTARPVGAEEALAAGLVDALDDDLEGLLRRHLLRLRHLSKPALGRYKRYLGALEAGPQRQKPAALAANRALFDDPEVRRNIRRYVTELKFPWEE